MLKGSICSQGTRPTTRGVIDIVVIKNLGGNNASAGGCGDEASEEERVPEK